LRDIISRSTHGGCNPYSDKDHASNLFAEKRLWWLFDGEGVFWERKDTKEWVGKINFFYHGWVGDEGNVNTFGEMVLETEIHARLSDMTEE
jgi:hypothetical protein